MLMFKDNGCFKNGCLGMVLLAVLFVIYSICVVSDTPERESQPFEVVTKTGNVTLHLGMPKDSVILLLGEPDESEAYSIGSIIINEIGYKVKDKGFADLTFRFENGKLDSFRQE